MRRLAGKNLVLVGFMGTGKTEVGRLLACSLNRRFLDTDQVLVERAGLPVAEIFQQYGEAYFRQLERELVAELAKQAGLVIATGGGIVLSRENVALLRRSSFVVWLDAELADLKERLAGDTTRPLLAGGVELAELYAGREHLYRAAAHVHVITTGKTPLMVADEILSLLAVR